MEVVRHGFRHVGRRDIVVVLAPTGCFFVGHTHLEVVGHGFRHVGRRDIVVVLVLGELE